MAKDYFQKNLQYLLDNKISVNKILDLTGLKSPSIVTMWKNGERQIMTKDLLVIANYLNYSIDDLLNKDISKDNNQSRDELQILFDKNYPYLKESSKSIIKTLLLEAHENIDKQLGEDDDSTINQE